MNDIPFLAVVTIWGMITAVFWGMTFNAKISMLLSCAVCVLMVTFQPYVCGYAFLLICFVLVTLRVLKDHKELVVNPKPQIENITEIDHPVYGFKVLSLRGKTWHSPMYGSEWKDGHLTAHRKPTMDNNSGVWVFKRETDAYRYSLGEENAYIVLVAISGDYCVEHEDGYRAEHADIVKVIRKGR